MSALFFATPTFAVAQLIYSLTPDWESSDKSAISTGAAWADINGDGWLDLVVANGNDIERQSLAVYYNDGNGAFPAEPDWQSADIDFHGHLSVGDVNNDGAPDVAVSVYLGPFQWVDPGYVKLYLNVGGELEETPSWKSEDRAFSFSCRLGDADGDGDLDLAVACGEAYEIGAQTGALRESNRIYYNVNGALEPLPGWQAAEPGYSYDVEWADFDGDGDLDLAFADIRGSNTVYRNTDGVIGSEPWWRSEDESQFANSLFAADINGDGMLDLAVSDNMQLGGSGRFKAYLNTGSGLEPTPSWQSDSVGYGSGIAIADVDSDGDQDVVTGGWWNPLRMYINENEEFSTAPQWTTETESVVEAIIFGDIDNDGLELVNATHEFTGAAEHIWYFPRAPLQRIESVLLGGEPIPAERYCVSYESGWISIDKEWRASQSGELEMSAWVSRDLDIGVSNWDSDRGNYVFINGIETVAINDPQQEDTTAPVSGVGPNPFNESATFTLQLARSAEVSITIYSLLGQRVDILEPGVLPAGRSRLQWYSNRAAAGVYIARVRIDRRMIEKTLFKL